MRRLRYIPAVALFTLIALLSACGKPQQAVEENAGKDPVAAVAALAKSLRNNDLQRFYGQSIPPDLRQRTEAAYDAKRAVLPPAEPSESEEFRQTMTKLTEVGAEDALYAELEPSLAKLETEVANQLPLMVAMGSGFASAAINESEKLSADEKQHASAVLTAVSGWASTAPIADRGKARAAIAALTASARAMQIADLDTLRRLSMNDALAKGSVLMAGIKQITALYGLDLDPALDSVKAELLESDADKARVKVSYTLLDKPVNFELAMVQRDGQWYSADAVARAEATLAALDHPEAQSNVGAEETATPTSDVEATDDKTVAQPPTAVGSGH